MSAVQQHLYPTMETLEKSRVCRLCGKQSGISIDIFDKNENHVRKINAILPILVHEMDLLPKQMCHRCSYKLEEFYNFYIECAKTDSELKNQLSWMRKDDLKEQIITPMVKVNPFKIKTEPPDCNDSDSNDVFGYISSYGSYASPILTCSRCRCICNANIKISTSPKGLKTSPKDNIKNQPHSSNVSNSSTKCEEWNGSENTDDNYTLNKNECDNDSLQLKNFGIKKSPMVNIDANSCMNHEEIYNEDTSKEDLLNRALRPRKNSVNYVEPKKNRVPKIKEQFKNREDIFDCNLVNHAKVSVIANNSNPPCPVIKLEKVNENIKSLRAHKNLEEFNKRVKEFNQTIKMHNGKNSSTKFLQRLAKRSKKSFQKKDNKKSSLTEKNLKRQSLQLEQIANNYPIFNVNKDLQEKDSLNNGISRVEMNINYESQQIGHQQKEILQEKEYSEHILIKPSISNNVNENITKIKELQIKKESVKETECKNLPEMQLKEQEKVCKIDSLKSQKKSKLLDRLPMCPIVKLEKDYTCNVDYPRVKIKRHLAVADPQVINGALEDPNKQKNVSTEGSKSSATKSKKGISSKNLKKEKKKLKSITANGKSGKVSKKKGSDLTLISVKKVITAKKSSDVPESEFKHFCEECDTCFKNKELYKLHPCYQK